eukprot:gnl/MRDRNA2_/MRDRNA2_88912_c0_seq1.p1 gnl/MRDRNA2_/MRDRNA2_88912_c0~~gnl/MRDRNA2_/MRDRNA2_88912_c0_seq1.p1  ORF type:complete len:361 (+),score=75.58 gnl/MRDRNA2_/MRDRNA2_88912_c0_seq1:135-1217(+)
MVSLANTERVVSVELEAHHRLCLEVSALQQELNGLKDGSWKKFQRPDPEDKKVADAIAMTRAEPSLKMRLCACGCGLKRQCGGSEQESLPPPLAGVDHNWTNPPPGADPAAQRAYHDKLAQPRKIKEGTDDTNSRRSSKNTIDPAYLNQLAIPREKARELNQKCRSGPVPKLPDIRGLQAKVIAANDFAKPPKPQKPPPFICCPANHGRSFSTPELQLGLNKPVGLLPTSHCAQMPRPQRRLAASRQPADDMPGLQELRIKKATDYSLSLSLPPLAKSESAASKQIVRTLGAQQSYIDQHLAAPPKPKRKQDALVMKLEALRRERLGREESVSQIGKIKAEQAPDAEEAVMPNVNWDLLI